MTSLILEGNSPFCFQLLSSLLPLINHRLLCCAIVTVFTVFFLEKYESYYFELVPSSVFNPDFFSLIWFTTNPCNELNPTMEDQVACYCSA